MDNNSTNIRASQFIQDDIQREFEVCKLYCKNLQSLRNHLQAFLTSSDHLCNRLIQSKIQYQRSKRPKSLILILSNNFNLMRVQSAVKIFTTDLVDQYRISYHRRVIIKNNILNSIIPIKQLNKEILKSTEQMKGQFQHQTKVKQDKIRLIKQNEQLLQIANKQKFSLQIQCLLFQNQLRVLQQERSHLLQLKAQITDLDRRIRVQLETVSEQKVEQNIVLDNLVEQLQFQRQMALNKDVRRAQVGHFKLKKQLKKNNIIVAPYQLSAH